MMEALADITLKEWDILSPDDESRLAGVSLAAGHPVRCAAETLSQQSMLEVTELRSGLRIQTFSYVGRIRLGNIQITVLPKIDHATLLNLLRYAYGFRKLRLFAGTPQRLEKAGFEDLLVAQLNAEVAELVARGLHRSYVSRRDRLASPRGRLDIQQFAKGGGVVTSALPCIHHPRIEDSLLNQTLLAGLQMAGRIASDIQLRRASRRLAQMLSEHVTEIQLNADVLGRVRVRLNRTTRAYEPSVTIIELLAESQGVSLGAEGANLPLPGFLFDMNRFFQTLISRFLRDNLGNCLVHDEQRLQDILRYSPGHNPKKSRPPELRPDFVIQRGAQVSAILDAKYRDLWEKSLPRDMLYQLAIYAASNNSKVATILYPTTDAKAAEARIDVRDPVSNQRSAQVRLRPVNLQQLEDLVLAKPSASLQRQKTTYAEWLAFGTP